MVSRRLALFSFLLLTGACWSAPRRAYYRPLGEPVARVVAAWADEGPGWRFEAVCQGSYLNMVDGREVRSVHIQLELARPARTELRLPIESLTLDLIDADGTRSIALASAWAGSRQVQDAMVVAPWARRPIDLFFDDENGDASPPEAVRLRWRHVADQRAFMHDCSFARVPPDAPDGPVDRPPTDREFGYRDGWYFPGLGELGPRALLPSKTPRRHYVFHSP